MYQCVVKISNTEKYKKFSYSREIALVTRIRQSHAQIVYLRGCVGGQPVVRNPTTFKAIPILSVSRHNHTPIDVLKSSHSLEAVAHMLCRT